MQANPSAEPRALWFLGPNGMPFTAASKKTPKGVTHQCFEGSDKWEPIAPVAARTGDDGHAGEAARP